METVLSRLVIEPHLKFKSYYVVWKLKKSYNNSDWLVRFKSYYVVWKLIIGANKSTTVNRFKSYYVVWKLPCPIGFSASQRFKSYYVVWKPYPSSRFVPFFSRLNRTMQYGNSDHTSPHLFPISFKSYYVVWKHVQHILLLLLLLRLNRTMQYGNMIMSSVFVSFNQV